MPDAHRQAVVYGTDQRVEALQHPSASLRAAARNGVMLVSRGSVTKGADGYLKFDALTLAEAQNLCPGEVFASQITPGTCSGFLIGGDRVISAGHCFGTWEQTIAQSNELCPFIDVVLDYELAANGSGPRVPNDRLFGCKRVLSRDLQENDAVQFELDRDTGRAGLTLDPVTPLVTGGALSAVGHPDGIAKKIVTGMRVRNPNEIAGVGGGGLFTFEGDLFHGNSGSPILDATSLRVVGVHSFGWEPDYDTDPVLGCTRTHRVADSAGAPAGGVYVGGILLEQTLSGTLAHSSGRVLTVDDYAPGSVPRLAPMRGDARDSFYYHPNGTFVVGGGWGTNVLGVSGSGVTVQGANASSAQQWRLSELQLLAFAGKCVQLVAPLIGARRLELRDCVAGTSAQRITLSPDGTLRTSDGRCVQPRAGLSTAGTLVETATCTGSLAQRWLSSRYGFFVAFNGASPRQCLEVQGGRPLANAPLQISTCRSDTDKSIAAQQFHARGTVKSASGQCLEGVGDSVRMSTCTSAASHRWDYYR